MTAVSVKEVSAGIVVHLNPEILKGLEGCLVKCSNGTEVKESHYFLVVSIDSENANCTAFPLYSRKQDIRDRIILEDSEKTGKAEHWIGMASYFFKWQFWKIPLAHIFLASFEDDSELQTRRFYAAANPHKLRDMTAAFARSRDEWRRPEA